ncbi:hypothetical protein BsWGS_09816 [Bradybaena similaris]
MQQVDQHTKHESADLKHESVDLKHESADLKHESADLKHESVDLKHESADLKQSKLINQLTCYPARSSMSQAIYLHRIPYMKTVLVPTHAIYIYFGFCTKLTESVTRIALMTFMPVNHLNAVVIAAASILKLDVAKL